MDDIYIRWTRVIENFLFVSNRLLEIFRFQDKLTIDILLSFWCMILLKRLSNSFNRLLSRVVDDWGKMCDLSLFIPRRLSKLCECDPPGLAHNMRSIKYTIQTYVLTYEVEVGT